MTSVVKEPDLRNAEGAQVGRLVQELKENGVIKLPAILSDQQLKGMQQAFAAQLTRLRLNNFDGYKKTEPYRHMVEDVLMLDQGFVDVAIHPLVKSILNSYLGNEYELVEAKGWKSLPTKRDFHGWHWDAWYDEELAPALPKEVKLAIYLTDVRTGAFTYLKGSHRKKHPRPVPQNEVPEMPSPQIVELLGEAGTAIMFDTSGIHRQGVPMLEPRQAIFYNYHDPDVPLQKEDLDTYRYHPLLLNAAFLGNLSEEDQRILGFGNKTNFMPAFIRQDQPSVIHHAFSMTLNAKLLIDNFSERVAAKLNRITRAKQ